MAAGAEAAAVDMLKKAASLGDPVAPRLLGWLYRDGGKLVARDDRAAFYWFSRAFEVGSPGPLTCFEMARVWSHGVGCEQNDAKATLYLVEAARQGDAEAQLEAGGAYHYGVGVAVDPQQAEKWYRLAALSGCDVAPIWLADMYLFGGLRRSLEKVLCLLQLARPHYCVGFYRYWALEALGRKTSSLESLREAAGRGSTLCCYLLSRALGDDDPASLGLLEDAIDIPEALVRVARDRAGRAALPAGLAVPEELLSRAREHDERQG